MTDFKIDSLAAGRMALAAEWQAESLRDAFPGLRHGFTAALAGENGNSFGEALQARISAIHAGDAPLKLLVQHHSPDIFRFGESGRHWPVSEPVLPWEENGGDVSSPLLPPRGDGAVLAAGVSGWVAVQTADCVPVLAANPELGEAAALHAGWRGIAADILPKLLAAWRDRRRGLASVRLAFGPSIRACCYEVGEDCLAAFRKAELGGAVERRQGRAYLELTRVLLNQARAAGLNRDQVEILPLCTFCHQLEAGRPPFASHRRAMRDDDGGAWRNGAYIGIA